MTTLHQLLLGRQFRLLGSSLALPLVLGLALSGCDDPPTSPDVSPESAAPIDAEPAAAAASAGAPYKVSIRLWTGSGYGPVYDGKPTNSPFYGDKPVLATSKIAPRNTYPAAVLLAPKSLKRVSGLMFCCRTQPTGLETEWTERAYFGEKGTFLADINDDDLDDLIAVNNTAITVKLGEPLHRFSTTDITWSPNAFYGEFETAFADVTGDGWADAIAVNPTGVFVSRGLGSCLFSCGNFHLSDDRENWTGGAYWGQKGTFFADVTGPDADGRSRADAIVVNEGGVVVRRALARPFTGNGGGYAFGPNEYWTDDRYYGNLGPVRFQDWNGDDKADAIVVNDWGITVRLSTGSRFAPNKTVTGPFYGNDNTLFVDLNGDKYLDIVALNRW
jgi:hypothetical protein